MRAALIILFLAGSVCARDWHVDPTTGDDANDASADHPLATAQAAVDRAEPGDVIHLHPHDAVYHQAIVLADRSGITIEGNGVTLTGADPMPTDGWEALGDGLRRRRIARTPLDRCLMIVRGRLERMGGAPGDAPAFPEPDRLEPGRFRYEPIEGDPKSAWLYIRDDPADLEWSVRISAFATRGTCRDVTVHRLRARHALNDGFNIHGDCRGLRFFDIAGYENYDEGFSAHDTCQTEVDRGEFYGNQSAVADVNNAQTTYRHCVMRQSMHTEVLFSGGEHVMEDCKIEASGPNAVIFAHGSRIVDGVKQVQPIRAELRRCVIRSANGGRAAMTLKSAGAVTVRDCTATDITLDRTRSTLTIERSTLDGQPWRFAE